MRYSTRVSLRHNLRTPYVPGSPTEKHYPIAQLICGNDGTLEGDILHQ
jgi:hypothetical protein